MNSFGKKNSGVFSDKALQYIHLICTLDNNGKSIKRIAGILESV